MVDVSVKGVLRGIAAVLPAMNAQGCGHIINIASIGGLQVTPIAAVYCATKYAVRAISEGLRQENDRIRVASVSPGVVESELADSISDEIARRKMAAFRAVALQPDAIGRTILHACAAGRRRYHRDRHSSGWEPGMSEAANRPFLGMW